MLLLDISSILVESDRALHETKVVIDWVARMRSETISEYEAVIFTTFEFFAFKFVFERFPESSSRRFYSCEILSTLLIKRL